MKNARKLTLAVVHTLKAGEYVRITFNDGRVVKGVVNPTFVHSLKLRTIHGWRHVSKEEIMSGSLYIEWPEQHPEVKRICFMYVPVVD